MENKEMIWAQILVFIAAMTFVAVLGYAFYHLFIA